MYLGIDVGGTKTLLAAFDADGTLRASHKFATPATYAAFLAQLPQAFTALGVSGFSAAALGFPAPLDRTRGVIHAAGGNLDWAGNPIAHDVAAIVGCDVAIENDANLAGLSEANLLRDTYKTALYITISTGIGGVFVIDGAIDTHTQDAEIGHMIYKQSDGSYKTWEGIASGKTIVERFGQRADEITDPDIWRQATEPIAAGIINVCSVLTPEVVIIGGGAGANLHVFKPYLDEWINTLQRPQVSIPPIVEAQHANEAVIYGCYHLAKQSQDNV